MEALHELYDISPLGFLPSAPLEDETIPLDWHILGASLTTHQVSDYLPDLPPFTWQNPKIAYALLTILANKYFTETSSRILPEKIGIPLWNVSQQLGIKPVLTHASVDLYNWQLRDPTKPFSLENIYSTYTLSPNPKDESWFYCIMVAIEGEAYPILHALMKLSLYPTKPVIYETFVQIYSTLLKLTDIIRKMYINCDPSIFYNTIRKYLSSAGSISFENVPSVTSTIFSGGSAAQSTLIPCIDAALGITHSDTYFQQITSYMPQKHAQFLQFVRETVAPHLIPSNEKQKQIHTKCIRALAQFRESHMDLVKKYILAFIQTSNPTGTGGTDLKNFLQTAIKETIDI